MDINKVFPKNTFFQGDTWKFNVSLLDYNATSWTLTYSFKKTDVDPFTITATMDTDGSFLFNVASTLTADYIPGMYYVVAKITNVLTSEVYTVGRTEVQIKPDISLATNCDPRSTNKIALEAVEAALAAGAGSDVIEYTVGGTIVKKNRDGLLKLRAYYLAKVRQEDGKPAISNILYSL